MTLLPDRHPQKDFFILDISDVVPKDDLGSMGTPIFSLSTRPDHKSLKYQNEFESLQIIPSGNGLPTIFDKDILIFCISQLMHLKNQGKPIGKTVRFSARELSIATNRPIGGNHYKRLEESLVRLGGARFIRETVKDNKIDTQVFGMIDNGGFVRSAVGKQRLEYCEVVLSDWLLQEIESSAVVTISPDYFRLRRPLERRLYEIGRKHCGNQKRWHISLEKLQQKTGSNSPLKKFRLNVRQIIEEDNTPFYKMELTPDDLVVFRPRSKKKEIEKDIILPDWSEDQARKIARDKGWDYHVLRSNWMNFAKAEISKGNEPKNTGASFVSYCNKAQDLRT